MSEGLSRRGFLAGSVSATAVGAGVPNRARAVGYATRTVQDADDLEAFLDETVEAALGDHDAAGAVVSVVRDGSVALSKGYGETVFDGEPMTAAETPVQIGSVSKLLTYTAAMGLVDDGVVETDEDVNEYLESVTVPETDDEPVTLEHLATHTPGFEIRVPYDTISDPSHRQSLEAAVGSRQPARIRPPGEVVGYTNYAAALTGQLVADVAGTSFADAVETSVFDPLGMDRSTFATVPEYLDDDARAWLRDELRWHSNVPPASGLWTTGRDMAQFVLAHLEGGATDEGRMLSEAATEEMHRQWFTAHEELDGRAFGFAERTRGDVRLLSHTGSGPDHSTVLVLAPELDVGLFVSVQGRRETGVVSGEIEDAFLERYIPTDDAALTPDGRPERADELAGTYRPFVAADHSGYDKLLVSQFYSTDLTVRIGDDGALITDTGDGDPDRWIEIEPLVFRRVDGQRALAFRETDGEITGLSIGRNTTAFTQISRLDEGSVQAGLVLGSSIVVLSGLLGWPLARMVRRYRDSNPTDIGPPPRARWTAGAAGGLLFGFLAALVVLSLLLPVLGRPSILDRPPRGFGLLFGLPILAAVATVAAGGYAVRAWYDGDWRFRTRVHYTAVVVGLAVLLWVFRYWNLLGVPT